MDNSCTYNIMADSVRKADEDERDVSSLTMNCQTIHRQLTNKHMYSLLCCSTSFILGWYFELIGPSLLELQLNTGMTFTMASTYITSFNVTHSIGSLGIGFVLYKRANPFLLIAISLAVAAASAVAIPFCLAYIPMMMSHAGLGISTGGIDIMVIAEMSALWGSDTEMPMHALYFTSALGTVLSPICMTPYLKNLGYRDVLSGNENLTSPPNSTVSWRNNASVVEYEVITTERSDRYQALEAPSRLYIPYRISAGLAFLILLPTLVIFIMCIIGKVKVSYNYENVPTDVKQVSGKLLYAALLVTGLMSALDTSIEESFGDFAPAFCVTQMCWTSQTSAYVVSVARASLAIGRLVGILLAAASFSSIKLMTLYGLLLIVAHIGKVISGMYSLDYGMWISSILSGFGVSALSPCIFTLAEDQFFTISGKVIAYFIVIASLGSGLNSFLIGYLMEHISNMHFGYALLIESVVYVFLIFICVIMIRSKQNVNDKSNESDTDETGSILKKIVGADIYGGIN